MKFETKRIRWRKKCPAEEGRDTSDENSEQKFRIEVIAAAVDAIANRLRERTTGLRDVTSTFRFLSHHRFRIVDDDSKVNKFGHW